MPALSRLALRAALLHLAAGVAIGALLLINKALPFWPWLWRLRAAHIHMLLLGWTVQFAFGVAYWILPRLTAAGDRGREGLAWMACFVLNLGVGLTVAGTLLPGQGWLLLSGGALYVVAGAGIAGHFWARLAPVTCAEEQRTDGQSITHG
jgi:hypothetical protein